MYYYLMLQKNPVAYLAYLSFLEEETGGKNFPKLSTASELRVTKYYSFGCRQNSFDAWTQCIVLSKVTLLQTT